MYGIEFPDLIRFFSQVGITVAASASLWGFAFLQKSKGVEQETRESYQKLATFLLPVFLVGFVVFLATWWVIGTVLYVSDAVAHEGIRLGLDAEQQRQYIQNGFAKNLAPVIALASVGLGAAWCCFKRRAFFHTYGGRLFLLQFLLSSVIIVFTYTTGELSKEQIFFWLHTWHSVLTVGTVIVIDVLYLATRHQDALKRVLYPFFPFMSAAIFIGLGIDFLSNLLIFDRGFLLTPQFYFSQTIVAILILNGTFMATRINNALTSLIQKERVLSLAPRMKKFAGFTGAVSITSWLSITFVDFFELSLSYLVLLLAYLGAVVGAYLIHESLEKFARLR